MNLRPYQIEFKRQVYQAFREGKQNVLAQLPTGSGKTIIFSSMIRDGIENNRNCLVLAHRGELITQAAEKLYKGFGIRCGIIKAGHDPRPMEPVQIASVQTLINRKLARPVHLVIIDESHHFSSGNTYDKIKSHVLSLNPDCKFLGVTATPCRTNGSGFKTIFDTLIQGISIADLIKQGFLTPPRYFVAPLDMGKVKVTAGDFNIKELSEAYQKKVHSIDLVNNWLKLAKGMKTIGFAVDVEHSKTIVAEFVSNNIPAAHIDGTTPDWERKKKLKEFETGKIHVLYNVGVFDEGFDCPEIEAVQLARPSKSLIKYMQMIGRALRPAPGKNFALVLDHSGLVGEHDRVEIEREWTLDGVTKRETNKELLFKDKRDGKTYKPEQLPLNIPMECIELVELTKGTMNDLKKQKMMNDFIGFKHFAQYKGFKHFWIWYQMARKVKTKDPVKAKLQLTEIAVFFCEQYGYKNGKAGYMVSEYLDKELKINN